MGGTHTCSSRQSEAVIKSITTTAGISLGSPCPHVITQGTHPLYLPLAHTTDNYIAAQHILLRPQQSATSRTTSGIRKKVFIRNFYDVFKLFFFQPSGYQMTTLLSRVNS